MKEVEVALGNGTLILSSKEARELFQNLTEDGIFWEFISGLFDERARGIAVGELKDIRARLTELEKGMSEIQQLLRSISQTGVSGNVVTAPPSIPKEEVSAPTQPVTKTSIKPNDIKGKGLSALTKMKGMGRK